MKISKRTFYPLALLMIPLGAMLFTPEVQWNFSDFLVMGFLLWGLGLSLNYVLKKTKGYRNRTLFIGVIVILFLVVWAELAVGVFGTPFAGS